MSDRGETKHLEPDSLLDVAPDAVVIGDEDGCIRFVNAQATVLLGYSCEELEGQPVELLVPERFRHQQEADRRHYMAHLYTRPMGHGQRLFVRRKDGTEFRAEISFTPVESSRGVRILSVIRDITKRVQAERSLRELASFAELNPAPVLRFDAYGVVLTANAAARAILGDNARSGSSAKTLIPGLREVDIEACVRTGSIIEHEAPVGEHHYQFVIRGVPSLGVAHVYGSDVTARRRDEQQLQKAHDHLIHELQAAAKMQRSLFPQTPPNVDKVRFDWCYTPCEALAGDLFNIVQLDERFLGVYIFDVSGHGVPAALLTATVSRAVARHARAHIAQEPPAGSLATAPVSWVAEQLNSEFPMDPMTGQYFTLLYGLLDLQTLDFRFVAAGHPGPIHVPRDGPSSVLETEAFPIGFFPDVSYQEQSLHLAPGDRLYLYTDGIPDATDRDGQPFGAAQLVETLQRNRSLSLGDGLNRLADRLRAWHGGRNPEDDMSILAVEVSRRESV
ncbi:MAG: SpoIIE family protein phosphatase [Pseudomonadales bacterium]